MPAPFPRQDANGGWLTADGLAPVACWSWGSGQRGTGVLLLPPLGYAYSSASRLLTTLARSLARQGCRVLQLDYPGTGDSAGSSAELDTMRTAAATAAARLRQHGHSSLVLLGVGWGGSLACELAASLEPSAVVAVAADLSGRRLVRQLRLLGTAFPDGSGGVSVGGYALSGHLLRQLAETDVTQPEFCPALMVEAQGPDDLDAPPQGLLTRWSSTSLRCSLETAAEEATVDTRFIDAVTGWVTANVEAAEPAAPGLDLLATTKLGELQETFVQLGPHRLPGVITQPGGAPAGLLVLLNSGSDPHTGPGRAWVELARWLAQQADWAVLRFDGRGWGLAPAAPARSDASARPYDAHLLDDVADVVADLRGKGWDRVLTGGLCAGAWVALQAVRDGLADGAVALNPQLYWQPGDPVEARIADTISRRAAEAAAIAEAAAAGTWDAQDRAGVRPAAGRWLDELVAGGRQVELLFTDEDPGLRYLRERLALRLQAVLAAGTVRLHQVAEIDHGLQQVWSRSLMYEAWGRALTAVRDEPGSALEQGG